MDEDAGGPDGDRYSRGPIDTPGDRFDNSDGPGPCEDDDLHLI